MENDQVVTEETPSPETQSAEPTPETPETTAKFESQEQKTEPVVQPEEEDKAQKLLDWATKKYPDLGEKSDAQKVAFLIERSIDSNREGRKLAREVKELKEALESIRTREPETPDVEPQEEPKVDLPNLQRYESRINWLQEKQSILATQYNETDQTINTLREQIAIAKYKWENEEDAALKVDRKREMDAIGNEYNRTRANLMNIVNESRGLDNELADANEQLENAKRQHTQLEQQKRRQEIEKQNLEKTWRKQVDDTAIDMIEELDIPVDDIDDFVWDVRGKVNLYCLKESRKGRTEALDLPKVVKEILTKEYGKKPVVQSKADLTSKVRQVVPKSYTSPQTPGQPQQSSDEPPFGTQEYWKFKQAEVMRLRGM